MYSRLQNEPAIISHYDHMTIDRDEKEFRSSGDKIAYTNDDTKNHHPKHDNLQAKCSSHWSNGVHNNQTDECNGVHNNHIDVGCARHVDYDKHDREHQESCSILRVCVFCGSQSGNKNIYGQVSIELGKLLVQHKMELVYGGGSHGLMGLISKVVHDGGGHVIGVLPKAMTPFEISGETVGELRVVANMHERKMQMAQLADAFITLPGGYGTLEELLEVITCSQLGLNDKPVGLLNIDGYYDPLIELFDKFVKEGFIDDKARKLLISATTPTDLICKLKQYVPINHLQAPTLTRNALT